MTNPHTFRKTGPRAYAVTVAATGAQLGTADRVSPDHVKTHPRWRAVTPAGETIGSHYPSRDYAAHILADHAAEQCEHGRPMTAPCGPCAVAGHEPTDVDEDQDDDGSGEAPVLDHERDAYTAPAPVDDRERMTAPARRGRYLLERTLPNGTVKAWPGTMSPREAGRAVAYCLHDNLGATRQTATRSAQRIESHPVGEWLDLHGYRFRLVTEAPTEDVEPARVELGAFHDPRVPCCDRDAADCDCAPCHYCGSPEDAGHEVNCPR